MTELAERLTLAMAGPPEIKPSELARACGIRQPSINDWLNGRTKKLEGANLLAAAECLKVNPWWLANGTGPMRSTMPESDVREAMAILQSMSAETRRIALAQIKALADLTSEKVNPVTAEKSGTIDHPTKRGDARRQIALDQGVTKAGEKLLDFDEAVTAAKRLAGVEGASRITEKKGKKSNQSG